MNSGDIYSVLKLVRRTFTIIADSGDNPTAGLDLLGWIQAQGQSIPVIVFCSQRAVSAHHDESTGKGAALCTSGVVSLLDSRISRRGYGKKFIASLPVCPVASQIDEVRNFFSEENSF